MCLPVLLKVPKDSMDAILCSWLVHIFNMLYLFKCWYRPYPAVVCFRWNTASKSLSPWVTVLSLRGSEMVAARTGALRIRRVRHEAQQTVAALIPQFLGSSCAVEESAPDSKSHKTVYRGVFTPENGSMGICPPVGGFGDICRRRLLVAAAQGTTTLRYTDSNIMRVSPRYTVFCRMVYVRIK